jgi:hypothetical protein
VIPGVWESWGNYFFESAPFPVPQVPPWHEFKAWPYMRIKVSRTNYGCTSGNSSLPYEDYSVFGFKHTWKRNWYNVPD